MILLYVFFPELIAFAISLIAKNVSAVSFLPILLLCSAVKLVYQYRIGFSVRPGEWLLPAACFLYEIGQLMAVFLGVTSAGKGFVLALLAVAAVVAVMKLWALWQRLPAETPSHLWKIVGGIAALTLAGFVVFFINGKVLDNDINGTYNWITIAGVSVQLSEIYKVFSILMTDLTAKAKEKHPWMLWVFCGYHVCSAGCLCILKEFGTAMQLVFFALLIGYLLAKPYEQGKGMVRALQSRVFMAGAAAVCFGMIAVVKRAVRWVCYTSESITLVGYEYQPPAGSKLTKAVVMLNERLNGLSDQILAAHQALWEAPLFSALNMRDYTAFHNADAIQFVPDYCFTVLCQVYGKLPVLLVLILVIFAAMRIVYDGVKHPGRSSSAAAAASAVMMLLQIVIHVLGPVRLMPFTGITLPFASLGGSSLIVQSVLLCFMLQGARESAVFEEEVSHHFIQTEVES